MPVALLEAAETREASVELFSAELNYFVSQRGGKRLQNFIQQNIRVAFPARTSVYGYAFIFYLFASYDFVQSFIVSK
jgi:hypothetical protein